MLRGRPTSAGCVCLQRACLPVHLCHALPVHLCHAMPTALLNVHAPWFCFDLPPPCSWPCVPGSNQQFASCKTVLLAATTRACSGGPCTVCFIHPSVHCRCLIASVPIPCSAGTALQAAAHGDCICAAHAPCYVHCAHFKGGGLGLRVSSRPCSLSLHFMSQRLHASSLAPC